MSLSCRFFLLIAVVLSSLTVGPRPSQAEFVITIGDVTVAAGETSFVDVLISSDSVTGDSLNEYFLDFTVTGVAQFAAPVNFLESNDGSTPAPQLLQTNPDYIFLGDSAEVDAPIGIDFVTDQAGPPVADDLISVGDSTLSFTDVTIDSFDGDFLLARLNFFTPSNATLGSVYDVNLDLGTSFLEGEFSTPTFDPNTGSITIGAAAVPEPSSLAFLACAGLLAFRRRQRGRAASKQSSVS